MSMPCHISHLEMDSPCPFSSHLWPTAPGTPPDPQGEWSLCTAFLTLTMGSLATALGSQGHFIGREPSLTTKTTKSAVASVFGRMKLKWQSTQATRALPHRCTTSHRVEKRRDYRHVHFKALSFPVAPLCHSIEDGMS